MMRPIESPTSTSEYATTTPSAASEYRSSIRLSFSSTPFFTSLKCAGSKWIESVVCTLRNGDAAVMSFY